MNPHTAAVPPGHTAPEPAATPERVAAIVLAAGAGSRFEDGPKLLAPFRGRPLAEWAVRAATEAGLDAVVVVTGALDLRAGLGGALAGVTVVENHHWRRGQATSLRAGLDWCAEHGIDAAVVGLADQPLVPASAWRAVAATRAPIATATYGGRRRPPARLDRSVWHLLAREGDEGARELMRRRPDLVIEVACEGDPADIDTVDDVARHEPGSGAPGVTERDRRANRERAR